MKLVLKTLHHNAKLTAILRDHQYTCEHNSSRQVAPTVLVFDDLIVKRLCHGDPAAAEVGVIVQVFHGIHAGWRITVAR